MKLPSNGLRKQRKSPDICRALLDSAPLAILAVGRDGRIIYMNETAKSLLNIHGKTDSDSVCYSEINPKDWLNLKKIISKGKSQSVKLAGDNHDLIVANRSPVFMGGNIIGAMSIFQHIDKDKSVSDHIRQYRELVRQVEAIIESSYDGIYVTDGNANTIRVNSAYERITGIKPSELIGHNMRDLVRKGYFSESVTLNVLSTKEAVTVSQVLKSGRRILRTGNPIFDETGKITMVVTNVRDMTDLTELNQKLEKSIKMNTVYKNKLKEIQRYIKGNKSIIAVSESMLSIYKLVEHISVTDATIFLYGETGVGKDRIAEEIHSKSARSSNGPIVKINCGAIPETLLESELFGYVGGAFTGAKREGKAGLFEVANKGTLFLDEVEAMPLTIQSKLLRVLQDFKITRLGSTVPKKIDVRLICASNQDLKKLVERNLFRRDLYYRLNVVPIFIPPLRERLEDIPPLINYFLIHFNRKHSTDKRLSNEALALLTKYSWPGNVREVENLIEQLVVTTYDDYIGIDSLPNEIQKNIHFTMLLPDTTLKTQLEELEKRIIFDALKKYGNARKASFHLGIDPSTVTRKIKRYRPDVAF